MAAIEVTGIDHLYVAVSDMELSERFWDPVMELLGFKKGTRPIAGEPHVHYHNRITQVSLRPAHRSGAHDPYRAGALHHLCFRVADHSAVDEVHRRLGELGVEASAPHLYEYRADYYATFFADPDGVRLEVMADTAMRRPPVRRNLADAIPADLPDELIEILADSENVRIERIVSRGHASPPGFWYDQEQRELVVVIDGAARLAIKGGESIEMGPGDWVLLDAHLAHRVEATDPAADTIWLAVFF